MATPEISIIIVSYNSRSHLEKCLESIATNVNKLYETIVVDNNSTDHPEEIIIKFSRTTFLPLKANRGFSFANNYGAKTASGQYFVFLNPDTQITKGSIEDLLRCAQQTAQLGAVAPRLLNPDKTTQASCFPQPSLLGAVQEFWLNHKGAFNKYYPISENPTKVYCAVGACLLIPRKVFDKVGGWDERFFMYYEDLELARQIKKLGLDLWYLPQSEVIHFHGASTSRVPEQSLTRLKKSSRLYHGLAKHLAITAIIQIGQKFHLFN